MRIDPPTYPLSREAFDAALRTGHGRAKRQIDDYGPAGLEDEVVNACVSCLTYDPQCEADRAPWLFAIVSKANLTDRALHALETAVHQPAPESDRDMAHWSDLLKQLAGAGSADARRLLYASLRRASHTADVMGAKQIVALDGTPGLIHVARQLGRWSEADPHFWADDYLISQLDPSVDAEAAKAALDREAENDADVAAFLARVRRTSEIRATARARPGRTALTGAQVVALIEGNPEDPCHWLRQWGFKATSDQQEVVFAALLVSDEPEHVKRFFRCFARSGVPQFDSRLVRWVDNPDEQVQWAAVTALAPVKHAELRQAAVTLIADGDTTNGVRLLVNNFESGDFAMCSQHLNRFEDADAIHRVVGSLMDLCEAHPGSDALDCILYFYELSPCSSCRNRAVEALIAQSTAPAWVIAEAALDADPYTRALVSAGT
jgi:hypothetical protein